MALDFNAVESFESMGDFPILAAGRYDAVIKKAEVRTSATSGNQYINLQTQVNVDGKKYTIFGIVSTATVKNVPYGMVLNLCSAAKLPADVPFSVNDLDKICLVIQGRTINIDVKIEEYNGTERNKIGWINKSKDYDATDDNDNIENILNAVGTEYEVEGGDIPF